MSIQTFGAERGWQGGHSGEQPELLTPPIFPPSASAVAARRHGELHWWEQFGLQTFGKEITGEKGLQRERLSSGVII